MTPIENCIACPHTVRVLKRAGIETMEQLEKMDDFQSVRGVGIVISKDLKRIVAQWSGKEQEGTGKR